MGYANRVVRLEFPEVSEPDDMVWMVIRNPMLLTADELRPRDVPMLADGVTPADAGDATTAMYEMMAKLIIGWHVYDASDISVDEEGNLIAQASLPLPATPALVGKLPAHIIRRLSETLTESVNPK